MVLDWDNVRRRGSLAIVAMLAVVTLAACGGGEPPERESVTRIPVEDAPADTAEVPKENGEPAVPADEEVPVLEAIDIAWIQTELTVPVGGTIELVNLGQAPHNFVIEGYEPTESDPVDMPIGGEVIEYTLPDDLEPGEYTYFCDVPGHQQLMRGTLTIESREDEEPAESPVQATPDDILTDEATPAATPDVEIVDGTPEADPAEEIATREAATPIAATPDVATPAAVEADDVATPAVIEVQVATPAVETDPAATPEAPLPELGTPAAATPIVGTPEAEAAETVRLEAVDIAWAQEELTVAVGGTIEMENLGQAPHNFVIVGYEPLEDDPFDLPVGGGAQMYTLPDDLEPGEYEYFCDVPGHQQIMRGTLIVTE